MAVRTVTERRRPSAENRKNSQTGERSGYDRADAVSTPDAADRRSGDGGMTTTAPRSADRSALLALDQVFAACGARLLREAKLMTGNRTEAEDLLQDAFLKALDRPEAFIDRSERDAAGWLWIVMRRTWRDRQQLSRHRDLPLDDLDDEAALLDLDLGQHESAEKDWELAVAYEGLARLGPKQRTAMVLLARGLGEQDAAEAAGVQRRTMREWRRDARRALGLFGDGLKAGFVCAEWQAGISSLADGEFGDGARRQALEAHLKHCRHCRMALGDVQRHSAMLQATLPVVAIAAAHERPPDASGFVHIGQQTLDNIGAPRPVAGHAGGWIAYLEDHWRLAASAAIAALTLWAVAAQNLDNISGALFGRDTAATPSAPTTAARATTVTVVAPATPPPAQLTRLRVPEISRADLRRVAAFAAAPRPTVRASSRTQSPAVTSAPTPRPAPSATECRTAECLFGP